MPIRQFTQSEILLKARRRLEIPLLMGSLLSMVAFSRASRTSAWLVVGIVAVGINLVAVWRLKEIYVHRLFVNIAVIIATVILVFQVVPDPMGMMSSLGQYIIVILACKLFERKRNRDYVQMLALGTLLMFAAAMVSQELPIAVLLAVYLVLVCYTTMVLTLKRGLDAAAGNLLATESDPPTAERLAWNMIRHWPGRPLRGRVAGMLLICLLAGAAVFLFAPRKEGEFPVLGGGSASITGYSSDIRLGDTDSIYVSNEVVMRFRLRGPDNEPRHISPVYMLGETYDQYRRSRWSKSVAPRVDNVPVELDEEDLKATVTQKVTMDSSLLPRLFASFPAVRARLGDETITPQSGFELAAKLRARPDRWVRYSARCFPHPLKPEQIALLQRIRRKNRWPGGSQGDPGADIHVPPRVQELARQWCEDLLETRSRQPERRDELDLSIARRIAAQLQRNYTYSLDLSESTAGIDGVEDFLFNTRRGHCEYFASAMTVMCRLLGVRAKLATGFLAEEYSGIGEHYIVRGRDAHAWTQVYTPATDWVIVDATGSSRRQLGSLGAGAWLADLWNSLQFAWYTNVVSYDHLTRRALFNWLATRFQSMGRSLRDSFVNLLSHGYVDMVLIRLSVAVGAVGGVVIFLLTFRWIRRRRHTHLTRAASEKQPWAGLAFIVRFFEQLEDGHVAPVSWTPRELVSQAARRYNLPAEEFYALVELYYRARWGGRPPAPDEMELARQRTMELSRLVSTRT